MLHILKINNNNQTSSKRAITIGGFDGIHFGHQAIITRLAKIAAGKQLCASVMIIEPQPCEYFNKAKNYGRVMSMPQKIVKIKKIADELLKQNISLDEVIILRFTPKVAKLTADEFINVLQNKLQMKYLLVGKDFHFGKNRQGSFEYLQKINSCEFQFECFDEVLDDKQTRYSSSSIRENLQDSEFENVKNALGEDYKIVGRVRRGANLASEMGMPTANLHFNHPPPLTGVYAGWVNVLSHNKNHPAVINIGRRPTIDNDGEVKLEAHILNFGDNKLSDTNLYGKKISVSFIKKIRDEQRFEGVEQLKKQISKDCNDAIKILI